MSSISSPGTKLPVSRAKFTEIEAISNFELSARVSQITMPMNWFGALLGPTKPYLTDVTRTVDITATGEDGLWSGYVEANSTLYYVWAYLNEDGELHFTLTTASNYFGSTARYMIPVGVIYNDGSGNFVDQEQIGSDVFFTAPQAIYTGQSLTSSYVEFSLPAAVPDGVDLLYLVTGSGSSLIRNAQIISKNASGHASGIFYNINMTVASSYLSLFGPVLGVIQGADDLDSIWAKSAYGTATVNNQSLYVAGYKKEW